MALDLTEIEILLQRRYNSLQDILRLTKEMLETISRGDEVSLSLMLDMRAEEIDRYEACQEEIWKKAEEGPQEAETVQRLMRSAPEDMLTSAKAEEQKVFMIRKKTTDLIKEVQQLDQLLNLRIHAGQPR